VIRLICKFLEKIRRNNVVFNTGLTQKGIEWQIAQLKKQGRLERIGPDRGGHWKVIKA